MENFLNSSLSPSSTFEQIWKFLTGRWTTPLFSPLILAKSFKLVDTSNEKCRKSKNSFFQTQLFDEAFDSIFISVDLTRRYGFVEVLTSDPVRLLLLLLPPFFPSPFSPEIKSISNDGILQMITSERKKKKKKFIKIVLGS